jgi:hypothetical protein
MKYYLGYKDCLSQADALGIQVISIDDCSAKSTPIPKQYNAEVLIKAIMQ